MRLPTAAAIACARRRLDVAPAVTWEATARVILRGLVLGAGRFAEDVVANDLCQERGAQVAGEQAPLQRLGRPCAHHQSHPVDAQVLHVDAVAAAFRRGAEAIRDLERRDAYLLEVDCQGYGEAHFHHAPR
jgi:hypothetical protein